MLTQLLTLARGANQRQVHRLEFGVGTIQVWAWYDPNYNSTCGGAVALAFSFGFSALYNINPVSRVEQQSVSKPHELLE